MKSKAEMAKQFWNAVMAQKPLSITTWDAVLRIEKFPTRTPGTKFYNHYMVSDPACVDAGMVIRGDDIKAILRFKPFIP